jgi:hypothetical protein
MSTSRISSRALSVFAMVLALASSRPLVAQQSIAPPQKDEATAIVWSGVVPGGGQFYAGKPVKGAILLGLTTAAAVNAFSCDPSGAIGSCFPDLMLLGVVSISTWTVGRLTAAGDAREYNENHARPAAVRPVVDRQVGRTRLGLALRY